jgi:hypothetical protein
MMATQAIQKIDTKPGERFLASIRRQAQDVQIKAITNDDDYQAVWEKVEKCDEFLDGEFVAGLEAQKKRLWDSYQFGLQQLKDFVEPVTAIKKGFLAARAAYAEKKERAAADLRRKQEDLAKKRQIEDARLLADNLRKQGAKEEAKAVVVKAKTTAPVLAPARPAVPKAAGSVTTTVYSFTIDHPELVPAKYRPIDESLVRKDVNAFGLDANIPGVTVTSHRQEHSR